MESVGDGIVNILGLQNVVKGETRNSSGVNINIKRANQINIVILVAKLINKCLSISSILVSIINNLCIHGNKKPKAVFIGDIITTVTEAVAEAPIAVKVIVCVAATIVGYKVGCKIYDYFYGKKDDTTTEVPNVSAPKTEVPNVSAPKTEVPNVSAPKKLNEGNNLSIDEVYEMAK